MTSKKSEIIQAFITQFERELSILTYSAKAAHEAATHTESRAEDKHDTFATEASYLAQGQANRVAEIERLVQEFRSYLDQSIPNAKRILLGTLVELVCENKTTCSFIADNGGGSQIEYENKVISIITPKSPLGEALDGLSAKDSAEVETKAGIKEYEVKSIE